MNIESLIMSTARSMENMDRKDRQTNDAIKWIDNQLQNPTPKEGVSVDNHIKGLKEAKVNCEALLELTKNGRKELAEILEKNGVKSKEFMALASVMQELVY